MDKRPGQVKVSRLVSTPIVTADHVHKLAKTQMTTEQKRSAAESPKGFFHWHIPRPGRAASETPKSVFKIVTAHEKLVRFLAGAGFQVRWIRREEIHPVWHVQLRRGDVPLSLETFCVRAAVCACLKKYGFRLPKREIEVSVRGDVVEACFLWPYGQGGSIEFYRGRETRQIGNWLGY